jgi:hypothetical protein
MLLLYAGTRALLIEPYRGDFVERNPGYGKHVAARIQVERGPEGPAFTMPRGAAASGGGRTGRLLGDVVLGPGERSAYGWVISDAQAPKEELPALRGEMRPWPIDRVEGAEGVTVRTVRTRLYASDLPQPPNYVSTSQWISIVVALAGVGVFLLARRLRVGT